MTLRRMGGNKNKREEAKTSFDEGLTNQQTLGSHMVPTPEQELKI